MLEIGLAGEMVSAPGLILFGLIMGILTGFFGVGGGFLVVPLLNIIFGIPYNLAVGSSLCQMVGTSFSGAWRHARLKNVDMKLGVILLLGSFMGVEVGARLLGTLKASGTQIVRGKEVLTMDIWMNSIYKLLLIFVGTFMLIETFKARRRKVSSPPSLLKILESLRLPPLISLKVSHISKISLWLIVGAGFFIGVLSGLLGVGGGFIMTPALIYLFGLATPLAIGTGLFQIIFTALFGTVSHTLKGNVDFTLVFFILCGSLIGAQIGALLTKKVEATSIRQYFAFIVYIAAAIIICNFLKIII
jgi:uncharacterized membrane protein YfcA